MSGLWCCTACRCLWVDRIPSAAYLRDLSKLVSEVQPTLVSDHLCWGHVQGRYAHDLLPLPFTEEAVNHVAARVTQVQDVLNRQIMLENVSSYVAYQHSTMTEWAF